MPRTNRSGRLTRTASAAEARSGTALGPPSLISLLAHTTRLVDLLPPLHQHALQVTSGSRSLLFEHNPRNGAMQATSGFGLDELPGEPWAPGRDEASMVSNAFAHGRPVVVADAVRSMPDLASQLPAASVLLMPLSRG